MGVSGQADVGEERGYAKCKQIPWTGCFSEPESPRGCKIRAEKSEDGASAGERGM